MGFVCHCQTVVIVFKLWCPTEMPFKVSCLVIVCNHFCSSPPDELTNLKEQWIALGRLTMAVGFSKSESCVGQRGHRSTNTVLISQTTVVDSHEAWRHCSKDCEHSNQKNAIARSSQLCLTVNNSSTTHRNRPLSCHTALLLKFYCCREQVEKWVILMTVKKNRAMNEFSLWMHSSTFFCSCTLPMHWTPFFFPWRSWAAFA